MFQNIALLPLLTVQGNVRLAADKVLAASNTRPE
jgi:ABC-type nitrate/sulfonate/bicarbonate transport system ATPase subunit